MIIKRAREDANFTVISNDIINDSSISFEATGVLIYMLSKPADWNFNKNHLQTVKLKCGRDKLTRIFKELEAEGYLRKKPLQGDDGKFNGVEYYIYSTKIKNCEDDHKRENRNAVKPTDGKPASTKERNILNTDYTKNIREVENEKTENDLQQTESDSDFFNQVWGAYPKRQGANPKQKAFGIIKARLKEGYTKEQILNGTIKYNEYCQATVNDPRFIMQATRFYGKELNFMESWTYATNRQDQESTSSRLQREIFQRQQYTN